MFRWKIYLMYGCTSWTLTLDRARKLRAAQRRMLRKVWGCSRKRQGQEDKNNGATQGGVQDDSPSTQSSSSSCDSSTSECLTDGSNTDSNQPVGDGDQRETYIEWLSRTAHLIEGAIVTGRVKDWVDEQKRRKFRWAGHVARRKDGRWTTSLLDWIPHLGRRAQGRPLTRWDDAIKKFVREAGQKSWKDAAQNRGWWEDMTEEFVKHS